VEDFVDAKFCCLRALVEGNHHIRIKEKMPEFSSTVLSTLSLLYHACLLLKMGTKNFTLKSNNNSNQQQNS